MVLCDKNIHKALSEINGLLCKKRGYAYASGYMETLVGEILTAFVPARDRHRMLDVITNRTESIKNEEATTKPDNL